MKKHKLSNFNKRKIKKHKNPKGIFLFLSELNNLIVPKKSKRLIYPKQYEIFLPPNPSLIIFCLRTMNSMMSY